jgi:hypothetical protein
MPLKKFESTALSTSGNRNGNEALLVWLESTSLATSTLTNFEAHFASPKHG